MATLLQAKANLLNALEGLDSECAVDHIKSEFRSVDLGKKIIAKIVNNASPRRFFMSLLEQCGIHPGGLDLFGVILEIQCCDLLIWPELKRCFDAYQQASEQSGATGSALLTDASAVVHRESPCQQDKLRGLSRSFSNCSMVGLQEALGQALRRRFPDRGIPSPYNRLLTPEPIQSWQDLLAKVETYDIFMDDALLAFFQQGLGALPSAQRPAPGIASLLLMVLPPRDPPPGTTCMPYDYRAYFCPGENSHPEEWRRLDLRQQAIPHEGWAVVLQDLLAGLIQEVKQQLLPRKHKLLLEIFLPREWLNEDIGSLITVQVAAGKFESLKQHYPYVLRSSNRFRWYREGDSLSFNALEDKWQDCSQALWWHDPTPAGSRASSASIEELEKHFNGFRVDPKLFGLKRLHNLPSGDGRNHWLMQMERACPAVALWWRPGAKSSLLQRSDSLTFSCRAADTPPFGSCSPSSPAPHHTEAFRHPDTAHPLRLFFDLADTLFRGRNANNPQHGPSFQEMALLVDCPDHWPLPVEKAPGVRRGEAYEAPEEEIYRSL